MLDCKTFRQQLQALGVRRGMSLLVHSSLRKLGPVEGGADGVIDCLLDLLGADGTLMMSTVSGNVNYEQPVFHVDYTPATVGALPNVFRQRAAVIRSLHPVHSIAGCGAKAEFFCSGHLRCRTAWSPDSPYGKLMRNDGFILFLGTDYSANTCMHALEIEARVPGLHTREGSILYVCDSMGQWQQIQHHWHSPKRDNYIDMEHHVAKAGGLQYGVTGNCISRLTDARILREVMLPILQSTPELAICKLSNNDFIWE